jgi:hypothetical protein
MRTFAAANNQQRRPRGPADLLILGALAAAIGAGLAPAGGCAQISQYDVQPTRVCTGDSVTVTWKATGSVTLVATPAIAGLGDRPSAGTASVAIAANTRLVLTASRLFGSAQREVDVVTAPGSPPKPFGGLATCDQLSRLVQVSFTLGPDQIASTVQAVGVTNPYDRILTVTKDDVSDNISPQGTSGLFKALPATGAWTVKTPLGDGETCDQALGAVSDRLVVMLQMSCGG